jgi:hypothetical protein
MMKMFNIKSRYMATKEPGYVYILTNPSFREDWVKIGKSSRPVDVRSKELDNTAVPLPFEIFATMKTVKYNEVEKLVHKTIDRLTDLRIRQNREFFNVAPQIALDIFRDIAMAIDDAEIMEYENSQPINPDTGIIDKPSKAGKTDTSAIQLKFWEEFVSQAVNHTYFYNEFSIRKAYPQHWYDLSVGSADYHICLTASRQKHELTAGIYVSDNKTIFHKFQTHADELEKEIGDKIEWREASKACRFVIHRQFDIDDKAQWQDALQWLYDKSLAIKKALKKLA